MNNRGHAIAAVWAAIACAAAVLLVAGCSTMVEGRALSMINDPFRVGDLPATNGPSGPRPNAPAPTGKVVNTNNGPIDKLALLSINDIEEYWKGVYSESLKGSFRSVDKFVSYDSDDPNSPVICRQQDLQVRQRLLQRRCDLIAWDRGVLFPLAQTLFRRYVRHRGVGPRVRPRAAADGEIGLRK